MPSSEPRWSSDSSSVVDVRAQYPGPLTRRPSQHAVDGHAPGRGEAQRGEMAPERVRVDEAEPDGAASRGATSKEPSGVANVASNDPEAV